MSTLLISSRLIAASAAHSVATLSDVAPHPSNLPGIPNSTGSVLCRKIPAALPRPGCIDQSKFKHMLASLM